MEEVTKEYEFMVPKHIVNFKAESVEGLAKAAGDSIDWSHQLLDIPSVWRKSTGRGVKVAVLDTGCDLDHPDLKDAIVASRDFTDDRTGVEDYNGHGTHCAGVIGARRNNIGFVGIAPSCELVIAKVLSNSGAGSLNWIADAIDWAVNEQGVDIISMSLGGQHQNRRLFKAFHNAIANGVIMVCAAGNEGSIFTNTIGYPGRYSSSICIGSHDENGNRSGFSSHGGEIDFMGPGSNIYSTYKKGGYASLSGTSMATPFVSGICALMKSVEDIGNCEEMRESLMSIAAHPGSYDNKNGYGPLAPFRYFYKG